MTKLTELGEMFGIPPLPSHNSDTIAALLWSREVLQKHNAMKYEVKDVKGIEELKSVNIGGVDQWLHIRGRNRANPVLLYLHGGPGSSHIGWMDAIQRPWEDYFTVVQWDQRQTGKSYYQADDIESPLTLSRFVEDSSEMVRYLLNYLDKEKMFLLGHSWGSVLGMHIVNSNPEWLYAYIGVGQVVSWKQNEQMLFERLLAHTKRLEEGELEKKLESISPYLDPEFPEKSFVENTCFLREELSRLAGETMMHNYSSDEAIQLAKFDQLISPHLTLTDIFNSTFGDDIALFRYPNPLIADFVNIDLPAQIGSTFEVPIFFFTGAHDWHTPKVLSDQWLDQINAPHKELIEFEESSHYVVNEEPGKVLLSLVNKVLPFSQSEK